MRAPLSWLRDYATFGNDIDALASTLSSLGLVVDGVTRVGSELPGVDVVRILAIRPHPDADRIRLVDVDHGDGEPLQIACGATNMAVGDLVPLATLGTVLPGGTEIARRKMRGQWSNGMLCAPDELDLPAPDSSDGLMILPADLAPLGTPLAAALDLRPDVVFDIDVTPNRPDALCIAGVARDLAAGLGLPWAWPAAPAPSAVDGAVAAADIEVDSPELCPRFTGTVIDGVRVGPSPAWMAQRLTLAGMRPINNVVDVSNYVMLDTGQPNHAYDLDRLGGGGLRVRRARPGETITTLDGVERTLDADDCVICDATSMPVGVAGIMGGAIAEVSPATTTVLLEAAYFTPTAVARTGKRLALHSEARTRFERGIDPELGERAAARFVELLERPDVAHGGVVRRGPIVDRRSAGDLGAPPVVLLRTERVNAILGTTLAHEQIPGLLEPLGFATSDTGTGVHSVGVPSWRPDTEREIDVIEEVGRLYGYHNIAPRLPTGRATSGLTAYQRDRRRVRDVVIGLGLEEAWTTTFLAPGDLERAGLDARAVEVENPLDQSESILRTSLLPGLLKAVRFNVDRQQGEVRLFEIGHIFTVPAGDRVTPQEDELLAMVVAGADVDGRLVAAVWAVLCEALRLEHGAAIESAAVPGFHPARGARVLGSAGEVLGAVGELDPDVTSAYGLPGRVGFATVDLPKLLAQPRRSRQARVVSRFPASDIDLAFVVGDDVPALAVQRTLLGQANEVVEDVRLFDVYRGVGDGRRSLAFRVRLRAADRTLTDAEVADTRLRLVAAVAGAHGGELRT